MPCQPQKTARQVALDVLNRLNISRHDTRELLHEKLDLTEQKAHATDIVYGTVRNRICIDMVIQRVADLKISRIQKKMLNILRIGVYELIYSAGTPEYAIVNEASQNAAGVAGKKQTGFVNAVLRNVIRAIEQRDTPILDGDPVKTIPVSAARGCRFNIEFLPSPENRPAEYLSAAFSLPLFLTEQWVSGFGYDKAKQISLASNRKPGIYLCPNTLKISAQQLLEKLTSEEITATLIRPSQDFPLQLIKIETHQPVLTIPGFDEGLFTVQDPTAAKVPYALSPKENQTIVDYCAAPGGKTALLAQLTNDSGTIIASDINSRRLQMVEQSCRRLGINSVKTVKCENIQKLLTASAPDAILLDVPCSNTGVLARRCELRLRVKERSIDGLAKTQLKILSNASKMIKTGGKICYSTCSIVKQENCSVVEKFLADNPDFKLEHEKLTLPFQPAEGENSFDHDGGYAAVIVKNRC